MAKPYSDDLRRQQPDSTLAELQARLAAEKQLRVSVPSLWVVLGKIGLRWKKSRSTRGERDTEANQKRRQAFLETLRPLASEKLMFLDESGVTTQNDSRVGPGPARRTDRRGHAARPRESADHTGHD